MISYSQQPTTNDHSSNSYCKSEKARFSFKPLLEKLFSHFPTT